jgi:hypothetical protein
MRDGGSRDPRLCEGACWGDKGIACYTRGLLLLKRCMKDAIRGE